jgi:diadenosine tetraphosphate (Ap4A) HIT family hydrolase
MPSLFTKIIDGELPAHFVWKDDVCVAFLSIAPLKPGHVLVVPRQEKDHWIDLDAGIWQHVAGVAQSVGQAVQKTYSPLKVGSTILGIEVPHVHVHVVPIWSPTDLDFHNADSGARPEDLAREADKLRAALRELGHAEVSD